MTMGPHGESQDSQPEHESTHRALDALLRRADRGATAPAFGDLEARILSAAAFPLAARRRTVRASMSDTLAAWVRVALPLAAAAAIMVTLGLSRLERGSTTVADAELRDSDPAALLSALESDGSSGLAHHLIANDGVTATAADAEAP